MTFSSLKKTLLGFVFLTITSLSFALDLNDPIPVGPQVTKGQLPNGLTYYIQYNTKPARKTELRLVVKAGSAMEDDDQKGLAHLLEHMAFNGSTHFKKHELISYLQSMGLKFGADLNAYTSFNETVYILPLPTTKPKEIGMGMQVLEDWAHGLTLNTEDIDAERSIVVEELRLGKGLQDRITKQTLPKLFQGSKYAERLPIGNEHDLKTFKPEALRRFYNDWYRPNLMAVVAVGDFDPVAMEALIKKHFSSLKNPSPMRPTPVLDVPANRIQDAVVVTDPENSNESVQVVYPVMPALDAIRLKDYRNDAVELLFNSLLEQRFALVTQQEVPPFIGGGARMQKSMPGYKAFSMSAGLNRQGLTSAVNALVQETERARVQGFTDIELVRVKKNYLSNLQQAYTERTKTESNVYAEEYIRNFLVNESIPGIVEEMRINKELLPTITLAEMNAYAKDVLPKKNAPALVLYSGASNNPATPTKDALISLLNKAFTQPLRAQDTSDTAEVPFLANLPKPGSIVSSVRHDSLNTTEYTLSNGLRVLVKPTTFKEGQIILSASRFGGQSLYGDADKFNANYATTVAAAMGLGPHSPTALTNILAGKMASLNVGMTLYSESIVGQSTPEDVTTMLEALHLRFAPMRKDPALFAAFVSRSQDATEHARARPEVEFSDALTKALFQGNPRAIYSPEPSDFSKLSLDRIAAIYNERFGSAKGFDFVLVGNIDPAQLNIWLTKYFATLPAGNITTTFRDLGIRTPTEPIKVNVNAGSEQKSLVLMSFAGKAPVSDVQQLRMQILMEVLNLRIMDVLREKKTLIYSGGIAGSLAYVPYPQYFVRASLPGAPTNVDAIVSAMEQEIRALQKEGPTREEMGKVMANWLSVQAKQEQDNEYWLGQLQNRTLYGKPLESTLNWVNLAMEVSQAHIQQAAHDYLPLNNYVRAVLSPTKAAK